MSARLLILDRGEELVELAHDALADEDIEIVSCTRIGSFDDVFDEGPFDVILAGPTLATRTGLRRLRQLHLDDPNASIILSFAKRPDASLRDIVRVGADDLLQIPADEASVRAVVLRALEIAGSRDRILVPEPVAATSSSARTGRVLTVSSPTGGCGKTFYATNLAHFLAAHTDGRVALVDLDLQFGEITAALRLQPAHTIYDALREEGDDEADVSATIESHLVPYSDRFFVLTAPKDPSQADRITPVEVARVIEALRARFDYVVVDTPAQLAETVLAAFDLSEHLFVLATLDLPSVRNLSVFLQTLEKLRIPSDNLSLVLNKIEADVGIDVKQIVQLFPQGFRSRLPYAKEVSRSINFGKPVLVAYPDTEVSRLLAEGMREFLPDPARYVPVAPPQRHGVFSRLLGRTRPVPVGGGMQG